MENSFKRDTEYWNWFYKNTKDLNMPSRFAVFCSRFMQSGLSVVDLGCGNGRDSMFFSEKGLDVTAIDASDYSISELNDTIKKDNVKWLCLDFVQYLSNCNEKHDYCYSRFTVHAIDEKQERILIENVFATLRENGLFFIEVRSVNDELFGKGIKVGRNAYIYDGHYRRFIVKEELESNLVKNGFLLFYSAEERGFAPYKDTDPLIIRIIAKKQPRAIM